METRRLIEATCPDCRGPLSEVQEHGTIEYRCLVGHRYSLEGVLQAHYETQERALWQAVLGLEEAEKLVEAVAPHMSPESASNLQKDAQAKKEQAGEVRRVLEHLKSFHLEHS